MAGKINVFNLGDLGVDLVKSPLHIPDGAWRSLQNAEFGNDQAEQGIKKRGALTRINSIALAGSVLSLSNVPIAFPGTQAMLVGLNDGETNAWLSTEDGADFTTEIAAATLQRASGITKLSSALATLVATNFFMGQRPASYKNRYWYAGDNYTAWVSGGGGSYTAPPLIMYDGTTAYELFRVPTNPTSPAGSYPWLISDILVADGILYLAVLDPGGTAPDYKGRVLTFDPSDGSRGLVGERFGDDSGELDRGYPHVLASHIGSLFAGTNGISGTAGNMGSIFRIQPGVETQWTEEYQLSGARQGIMSMAIYGGAIYASTSAGVATNPLVVVRSAAGTWSTSYTSAISAVSYIGALIVFNGLLFGVEFDAGNNVTNVIVYDGSSWSTDYDVAGNHAADMVPGTPFVFQSKLFIPFMHGTSGSNTDGFLLSRNTSGTWVAEETSRGLRGCLGTFTPES